MKFKMEVIENIISLLKNLKQYLAYRKSFLAQQERDNILHP
jgi:hypothetical protein